MGSPVSEAGRYTDEGPRHEVTIGYAFAVGVYEVTLAEWDACVGAGGCGGYRPDDYGWGRGGRPAIYVNWQDAQAYVAWLSGETGEEYRLLSEAEWEYVARAGTQTARHWGAGLAEQCVYANGYDRIGQQRISRETRPSWEAVPCSDGHAVTAPVGSFRPNAFGLYDVLGNVWEWTEDCWNGSYAGAPADGNPWITGDCTLRVTRGGSGRFPPRDLRSAYRHYNPVEDRHSDVGFRVARTMK